MNETGNEKAEAAEVLRKAAIIVAAAGGQSDSVIAALQRIADELHPRPLWERLQRVGSDASAKGGAPLYTKQFWLAVCEEANKGRVDQSMLLRWIDRYARQIGNDPGNYIAVDLLKRALSLGELRGE